MARLRMLCDRPPHSLDADGDAGIATSVVRPPDLAASPMHGEVKLRREGLRTRDGHLLEWFTRLRPSLRVNVYSRPEPWPRIALGRRGGVHIPEQLSFISPQPVTIPNLRHRRDWWSRSMDYMTLWEPTVPAIIWNPLAGAGAFRAATPMAPAVFDLLDDWLAHPAFARLKREVGDAYGVVFDQATVVTANSEATLALARRFGREDAVLLRNGVDPERFDLGRVPHDQVTVGYGGKIGFRIDVELVEKVARAMPNVRFEFAGPVLARRHARELRHVRNVVLLGDVRYDRYPQIMRRWDIAWAPHRLDGFEVGGDLIKLYEYRAAGLPTVSTRVIGWERALDGVRAVDRADVAETIEQLVGTTRAGEVDREPIQLPRDATWCAKADFILDKLGLREPEVRSQGHLK